MLAFIISHVFIFIEIFVSAYKFELTVLGPFVSPKGLLENFVQGRSSGDKFPQLLFSENVLIFLLIFERQFC